MKKALFALLVALFGLTSAPAAQAADACKVVLCVAGNWKNISTCVPPVRQAMHDAALGRGWPTCNESGPGNSTAYQPVNAFSCPDFYGIYNRDGFITGCKYTGVVHMEVNGQPWADIYTDVDGNTSTHYTAAAKAQLGSAVDPKYDEDQASWVPPPERGPAR